MTYFVRMNTYYRRVLKGGHVCLPTYREAREDYERIVRAGTPRW